MPLTVTSLIFVLILGGIILFIASRGLPEPQGPPEDASSKKRKTEEEDTADRETFLPEDKELNALGKIVKALETAVFVLIINPLRKLSKKLRYKKLSTEQLKAGKDTYELDIYMLRNYKYAEESAKLKTVIKPIQAVVRADTYQDLKEVALSEIRLHENRKTEKDVFKKTSDV
ncbi:hypothetical protein [Alkalicoccus saliphilus]|uniref:Uncharacterized protein n=1 Tax=Alkalicoccus saliphilus TaxID=200989 RepID=A0A2T4U993_9BACI|nr:hypothetical protein [Alkalicoccus saliphilus]PTL39966.1 hypothetical protein C6Y45_03045 [Alkalicoccus saliphilus]